MQSGLMIMFNCSLMYGQLLCFDLLHPFSSICIHCLYLVCIIQHYPITANMSFLTCPDPGALYYLLVSVYIVNCWH